jgi:hypothetical protein
MIRAPFLIETRKWSNDKLWRAICAGYEVDNLLFLYFGSKPKVCWVHVLQGREK